MRIGLLADGHGNVEAFDRGLRVLREAGSERIYFLGDAVGYLPGDGILIRLREEGIPCVRGNHEAMLLDPSLPDEKEPIYRLRETLRGMDDRLRAYVASWPIERRIDAPCGPLRLMHGSPADPVFGYVHADTALAPFGVEPGVTVLMAHTHRPFIREHGGATFVNVGSCGLPRDSGILGAACILDDATGDATVLRFDIAAETARALDRCGPVAAAVEDLFAHRREDDCFGVRHDD